MILDIICYRNKKMKCYTNPIFTQEKLENLERNTFRALIHGGEAAVSKVKNLALYHFGTFDDEAGKYDLFETPVLLFDCDDLISQLPTE